MRPWVSPTTPPPSPWLLPPSRPPSIALLQRLPQRLRAQHPGRCARDQKSPQRARDGATTVSRPMGDVDVVVFDVNKTLFGPVVHEPAVRRDRRPGADGQGL